MWTLAPGTEVAAQSTEFGVSVTRLGCSGGITGTVLEPTQEVTDSQITITFEVASLGSVTSRA